MGAVIDKIYLYVVELRGMFDAITELAIQYEVM